MILVDMAGNHLNPSGDGNLVEADDSADESAERILESVTSDNLSDGGNHIDSKVEEGEKLTSNDYLLSNITELESKMVQMGNENRRLQVKIEEQEFNTESLLSEVGGPMSMEGSPALASSANIPWRNCNETYRDLPVLRDATDKDSVSDGANRRETLTRLDNYEKENSHFFKLNEDIFSYLVCYPLKSIPSLYSMCTIFFLQFGLVFLFIGAQTNFVGNKWNHFRVPVNVTLDVRLAQCLTLAVAIFTQDDILSGLEGLLKGMPDRFKGSR